MIDLGKHIMDQGLLDKDGKRAGKVDDLALELEVDAQGRPCGEPEVVAIVAGPFGLVRRSKTLTTLARIGYWLLGVRDPHPVEIGWSHVAALGVVVHLDVERDAVGLDEPSRSAARRYIEHIPGA